MIAVSVALIQAAPVMFDKTASITKACRLIREAGEQGVDIILLPEAFVPAYPRGLSFGMVVGSRSETGRALWKRYWDNAVRLDGDDTWGFNSSLRHHIRFSTLRKKDGPVWGRLRQLACEAN